MAEAKLAGVEPAERAVMKQKLASDGVKFKAQVHVVYLRR